jgi:hypothetical protein
MPLVGFEPMISAGEQPKTYALDRAAAGTGHNICTGYKTTALINTVAVIIKMIELNVGNVVNIKKPTVCGRIFGVAAQ